MPPPINSHGLANTLMPIGIHPVQGDSPGFTPPFAGQILFNTTFISFRPLFPTPALADF